VKNGDLITLDADKGLIQLEVTSAEIKRRRTATPLQGRCSRRICGARVECERRRCPDVIASESIRV
jgi:dihydroxyacid dehydratase/phosphogluconate dehydratase